MNIRFILQITIEKYTSIMKIVPINIPKNDTEKLQQNF